MPYGSRLHFPIILVLGTFAQGLVRLEPGDAPHSAARRRPSPKLHTGRPVTSQVVANATAEANVFEGAEPDNHATPTRNSTPTEASSPLSYNAKPAEVIMRRIATLDTNDVVLWPLPAKILVVIMIFVVLEYAVDSLLPWCGGKVRPNLDFNPFEVAEDVGLDTDALDGESEADPARVGRLSVLTLNVWVNKAQQNIRRQVQSIRALRPDVICLQEVFHLDVLEAYQKSFPDYVFIAFGRSHNLSALVAVLLIMVAVSTGFSALIMIIERATHGRWRTTWLVVGPLLMLLYTRLIRHHWAVAFLTGNRTGLAMLVRREKITLNKEGVHCVPFSPQGHADDVLNLLRPRGFISVSGTMRLKNGTEMPVRFVTTHLNQPVLQERREGRHRQVAEILQHASAEDEFFVMGCDLNATPPGTTKGSECNTYSNISAELNDAWSAVNPANPNSDGLTWDQVSNPLCCRSFVNDSFYGTTPLRWRCDFIFWRHAERRKSCNLLSTQKTPAVKVRRCEMVFTGKASVSDHFGVYSVFDIGSSDMLASLSCLPVATARTSSKA